MQPAMSIAPSIKRPSFPPPILLHHYITFGGADEPDDHAGKIRPAGGGSSAAFRRVRGNAGDAGGQNPFAGTAAGQGTPAGPGGYRGTRRRQPAAGEGTGFARQPGGADRVAHGGTGAAGTGIAPRGGPGAGRRLPLRRADRR